MEEGILLETRKMINELIKRRYDELIGYYLTRTIGEVIVHFCMKIFIPLISSFIDLYLSINEF